MTDDSFELREELAQAWHAVITGAVERGYPPQAVLETMVTVAHERFADVFGPQAAASYLQLLAEQLRTVDQDETMSLVRGEQPVREDQPDSGFEEDAADGNWIVDEPLL